MARQTLEGLKGSIRKFMTPVSESKFDGDVITLTSAKNDLKDLTSSSYFNVSPQKINVNIMGIWLDFLFNIRTKDKQFT